MSDSVKRMKAQLDGIKTAYNADASSLISDNVSEGFQGLKSRIRGMDIKVESTSDEVKPEVAPRFTPEQIAEKAIDTYKTKINPLQPKQELDTTQPTTHARRTNMKAMAKALTGMRGSGNAGKPTQNTPNGNGDLGQYTSPANNNDGDLGNNTAYGQYYSLTTSMTLEQYEDHINKKFLKEEIVTEAPLVCGDCGNESCKCDDSFDTISELKERLLTLEDTAWQSIDIVMRQMSEELEVSPKELHRAFKSEEGVIPDEWLKENREVQLCGWMPLDEAVAINKIGMVYDVTCMWRGQTMRTKFFWPETTLCSRDECQRCCEMLYPGSRLIAHYPSQDKGDNYMVMVPPMKESFEFVPEDTWLELDEEHFEFYNYICEEVGEPLTPMVYHDDDDSLHVMIENHDTGEHELIIAEAGGLHDWFNNSKSKDGKPGWVNVVTGGTCASDKKGEGTPKCVSSSKRASMSKSERQSAASRKKAADPGQQSKSGAAKPTYVSTDKPSKKNEEFSIDEACWAGYTQKGMKTMFGKQYPNCVKKGKTKKEEVEYVMEGGVKSGHKRPTDQGAGLTQKGVDAENAKTGGNLQTAVTTPPSKLKAGSKAAGRRKSFCARSRGWNGERGKAARRRWNC